MFPELVDHFQESISFPYDVHSSINASENVEPGDENNITFKKEMGLTTSAKRHKKIGSNYGVTSFLFSNI